MILSAGLLKALSSGSYTSGYRTYGAGVNQTILNTHIPAGVSSVRVTLISASGGGGAYGGAYGNGTNGGTSSWNAGSVAVTISGSAGTVGNPASSPKNGSAGGTVSRTAGIVGLGTAGPAGVYNTTGGGFVGGYTKETGTGTGFGIGAGGGGGMGMAYFEYPGCLCGSPVTYASSVGGYGGKISATAFFTITNYEVTGYTASASNGISGISDPSVRSLYPSMARIATLANNAGDGGNSTFGWTGGAGSGGVAIFIVSLSGATQYTNAITVGAKGIGGTGGYEPSNGETYPNGADGNDGICLIEW